MSTGRESVGFYEEIFGMQRVPTPNFGFPVQWLRVGSLQLHLFERARLRRIVVDPKSLMPTDYDKRLTAAEFKDLLAFLTRQGTIAPLSPRRGGPPAEQ